MKRTLLGCGLILGFVAAGSPATPREQDDAGAAIKKLGGTVEIDDQKPGKPVIKVDLHETKITDTDLGLLKSLPELRHLDLRLTKIGDAGVVQLKELKELRFVNLFRTQVTDAGLKHLTGNKSLETLLIGGTKVTDDGLALLKAFPQLKKLSVFDTQIGDAGLKHLAGNPDLEILLIGKSRVTEDGKQTILKARPKLRFTETVLDDGAKKEAEKLRGRWSVVSAIDESGKTKPVAEDDPAHFTFEFTADKLVVKLKKATLEGTYTLGPSKKPMEIDIVRKRGDREFDFKGIFSVENDKLMFCLAGTGNDRPKEFKQAEGIEFAVELKRIKP